MAMSWGVHHLVLGRTGMDVPAVEHHLGSGGVEVLVLQFTQGAAVGSVGKFGPEVLLRLNRSAPRPISSSGVKPMRKVAWGSGEARRRSAAVRISAIPALSSAPQERGAVGDNEVLAPVLGEAGEVRFLHHNVLGLV